MKKIIFVFLLSFTFFSTYSQYVHQIKADSVRIHNDSCNAELILENRTKDTLGFLYNKGNGRTEFKKVFNKLSDSGYVIGNDTLNIRVANGITLSGGQIQLGRATFGNYSTPSFSGTRFLESNNGSIYIRRGIQAASGTVFGAAPHALISYVHDTLAPGASYSSFGGTVTVRRISGSNGSLWGRNQSATNNSLSVRHYFAEENLGFNLEGRTIDTTYIPSVANVDAHMQFGNHTILGNRLNGEFANYYSTIEAFNYGASSNGSYLKAFFDFDAGGREITGNVSNFEIGERVGLNIRPIKSSLVDSAYAIRTRGTEDSIVFAGPVKLLKYKNNATSDSVLTTDAFGNIKMKYALSGSYSVVKENGSALTKRDTLNFVYGVTAADNGGAATTDVNVDLSTSESFRTSDQTLTANTFADATSFSLSAGTWLISGNATVESPNNTAQRVTFKLWDGTTIFQAGEASSNSMGGSTKGYVSLPVSGIVVLASSTTIRVSVASTVASIIKATPGDNNTGTTNKATSIRAVRVK